MVDAMMADAAHRGRKAGIDLPWIDCGGSEHQVAGLDACEQVGDALSVRGVPPHCRLDECRI